MKSLLTFLEAGKREIKLLLPRALREDLRKKRRKVDLSGVAQELSITKRRKIAMSIHKPLLKKRKLIEEVQRESLVK
jgi:hypothetical protein